MDELTSRVISFIRFPMMAAVVAIHCNLVIVHPELESRNLFHILFSLTYKLIWVSVPIFFFISGLLFFREGTFNISIYKEKIYKRIFTLLVPYILWNIIYFFIVAFLQYIRPDLLLLIHKRIVDFSWTDYLWIFWDIRQISHLPNDQPACLVGVFWFIQCLFISYLLSPIIYKLIKYTRHFYLLIFLVLCLIDYQIDIPGMNNIGIAYFCLGAYISIMRIDFVGYLSRISLKMSITLVFISLLSIFIDNNYIDIFFSLLLQIGIFSLITYIVAHQCWHENKLLVSSVFFIFAIHRLFTTPLIHITNSILLYINSDILLYLYYLLIVGIAILLSIATFWFMKRYLPKTTSILCGNRSII